MSLTFACPHCGKLMKNDAVCGACGYEFKDDVLVHDPGNNPMQPIRAAEPAEVKFFMRKRLYPIGHKKNPARSSDSGVDS